MREDRVLVRAFQGEPLIRVVFQATRALVYVCKPEHLDEVASGERSAVGFPAEDVFDFEEALFEDLQRAYANGEAAQLRRLWQDAREHLAVTA